MPERYYFLANCGRAAIDLESGQINALGAYDFLNVGEILDYRGFRPCDISRIWEINAIGAYDFLKAMPILAFRRLRSMRSRCDNFRIWPN